MVIWVEANPSCFLCLFISVLPLEVQLLKEGWDPINQINPATFLCLSQVRTWISKVICHVFFYIFEVRGDCSFLSYWRNCWPSPFKLSFNHDKCIFYLVFDNNLCLIDIKSVLYLPRHNLFYSKFWHFVGLWISDIFWILQNSVKLLQTCQ